MNIQNGDTRQVPEKCIELFVLCFGEIYQTYVFYCFFWGSATIMDNHPEVFLPQNSEA